MCLDAGVRVGCFRPPSVPSGRSCLRLTARADLTAADLDSPRRALTKALRVSVLIVTGTGTDVGKTVVTAALAACATGRVAVVKPAQTGVGPGEPGDLAEVTRLSRRAATCTSSRATPTRCRRTAPRAPAGMPALDARDDTAAASSTSRRSTTSSSSRAPAACSCPSTSTGGRSSIWPASCTPPLLVVTRPAWARSTTPP